MVFFMYKKMLQNCFLCILSKDISNKILLILNLQVLLNGECVDKKYCFVCDDEGHRFGDVWQKSACERCSCEEFGESCTTIACPKDTLCAVGYVLQEVS